MFFRKTKSLIGLDVGSSAVKAVELRQTMGGYRVVAGGTEPVPPDSIVDGAIVDGAIVAEVIRHVLDRNRIKSQGVVASLSGNAVIVKKVTLPLMSEDELAESIFWEAEQYIPFDIQDVNLDYQVVQTRANERNRDTMDVLLVAAKKEKIADYTWVISRAGRIPVVVDVDAFALQNAFEARGFRFAPEAPVEFQAVLFETGCVDQTDTECVYDPQSEVSSYVWDFGDGTTGSGATAHHAYSAAGVKVVTLTAIDEFGRSESTA